MNSSNSNGSVRDKAFGRRHDDNTIAKLEEMFKEFPNPDETKRLEIGRELGLEPRQVQFWYQNKKIREKALRERSQSDALVLENKMLQSENLKMRETLKNSFCTTCKTTRDLIAKERELSVQNIRAENSLLTKELGSKLSLLTKSGINPMQHTTFISSHDIRQASLNNQTVGIPIQHTPNHDHVIPAGNQFIPNHHIPIHYQLVPVVNQGIPAPTPTLPQDIPVLPHTVNQGILALTQTPTLAQNIPPLGQNTTALGHTEQHSPFLNLEANIGILNNNMLPQPVMSQSTDMEYALMSKIANDAMEELMKLLTINEPFWFKSVLDGKFILQHDMYKKTFGSSNHLTGTHARIESSKDSLLVNMGGTQLIEMFLDSEKWVDLLPAIVKNSQTIKVFESGLFGNRNGAMQLMSAEMHILSDLVPTREFFFLRYCKQIQGGEWAIGDVSVDSSKYKTTVSSAWRLPSGCLIQEINQGLCKVTWVEHVEVDDKIQTHELFRDIICENNAYGAKRWVLTLQRMCERFQCVSAETIPSCDVGEVIKSLEGRKSVMNLSHRMVKNFLENLDLQDNGKFPHLTRMTNDGVRSSIRENITNLGVPKGMIFCAATTFWLPLSPQNVFDFLMDNNNRPKWNVLYDGNEGRELHRISTGTNPQNYISIIWPYIPSEMNNVVILQESYEDALGYMLVYTPLDMTVMDLAIAGKDMSLLPLLPSGITISSYDQSNILEGQFGLHGKPKEGSLVTLMSQYLACSPSEMDTIDMKFAAYVKSQVTSTAKKIKAALNCSNI